MCSGSEAGSYFRPIDFVYHSTLGLRVTKKKRRTGAMAPRVDKKVTSGAAQNSLEGVPREQKMLKGHLPRVIYHPAY